MKDAHPHSAADPDSGAIDVCTTAEAAALLGVSHRTIQLWVENGTLHAWRTSGGHRRIATASVHAVMSGRAEALAVVTPAPPTPPRRILLVDDDPALLRLHELEIGGWGLHVETITAGNGYEALIRIGEARPDLLISDLTMPGMDGFRMIRTLRANPAYAGMPVIVISGLDRSTIAAMALPEDIPVLPKPAPFAVLRNSVERALGWGA
ncbi:response regulator [Massilia sp. 9096]|uniref:response regulator n=1 Tax=Massilia sp. 9096 TaxID=1500894 RepID=UPI00068AD4CE|nr:response regulator [Massilia sp. 9096]